MLFILRKQWSFYFRENLNEHIQTHKVVNPRLHMDTEKNLGLNA